MSARRPWLVIRRFQRGSELFFAGAGEGAWEPKLLLLGGST